jgi:ATP-binding cassette subfamily B protein
MAMYANTESNYIDTLGGITEIKGLAWNNFFREKNLAIFSGFQDRVLNLGRLKVKLGTLAGLAGVIYLVLVFAITSIEVFRSGLTSGELLAVISICSGMLPSVLNLSLIAIPLSEVNVALSRMFEFTRSDPEKSISGVDLTDEEISEIELNDISFRFPGRHLLLERVNLKLAKGSVVSVSGESGGGKSTLAGIIMRFYEPETGNIIINGDLRSEQIPLEQWRSKVGIVPQDIHIFNSTILENILLQDSEKKIDELVKMIREFGLTGFFDSFPAGILTRVGEDGLSLSGGQKQIIAFVRALFRKPDFLIMDEGTSSLDKRSEEHLMRIISMIKRNTGILMISHRGDLIKEISDQVYILEHGVLSCMSVSKSN